jgi:hypothetical protein
VLYRRINIEEINNLLRSENQKVLLPRIRKAARAGDIPETLRLCVDWVITGHELPPGAPR